MACHVDAHRTGKNKGEIYQHCCLDYHKPDECEHAVHIFNLGLDKKTCSHWIVEESKKCECCGQYLNKEEKKPIGWHLLDKSGKVVAILVSEHQFNYMQTKLQDGDRLVPVFADK